MSVRRDISELPRNPAGHFQLHVYAAVIRLRARLPVPSDENGLAFLSGYYEQLAEAGFGTPAPDEDARWWKLVRAWEPDAAVHLPLRALRDAGGLDPLALALLLTVGLGEEDVRFAQLFEALNGITGEARPTLGLLANWTDDAAARDALHLLLGAGLLEAADADSRAVALGVAGTTRALGGHARAAAGRARAVGLIPAPRPAPRTGATRPSGRRRACARAGATTARGGGAAAARRPRPAFERSSYRCRCGRPRARPRPARDPGSGRRHAPAGPLATLLHALPVIELDPAPGETVDLPRLRGYAGPLAAVAGRRGGIRAKSALTLRLGLPDPALRVRHWTESLDDVDLARELAVGLRTTSGAIRRVAELARAEAEIAGRPEPTELDVRSALRTIEAEALETLATRVPVTGGWDDLAVGEETARELELLERRCRAREQLHEGVGSALGAQLTPGVRALFSGPSGTGKTLAARLLAASLGKELFSVDLATVVNKYLGETEKNLDAVFSRAEELDVVLMLDEGDALMTRRTDVHTSNDRYANLETNFLLQRLESYEGILVVTTNAGERIDPAFRRRLDVVVEFRAPDAFERWSIWQLHLPPGHAVDESFLDEASARCQLTGGQIRNAVLHASLLALDDGGMIDAGHVEIGVRREYRKSGGVCPLRPSEVVRG